MFHNNQAINDTITEAVTSFAKENKISRSKTEKFVIDLLALLPKQGKPVSDESLRIRQTIKDMLDELKQYEQGFTAKEVAARIEAEPAMTINALKWLAQHENIVMEAGKLEKQPGERGKRATLWMVA